MTENLDRALRYLRPVARIKLPSEPDLVHLSVYQWLPQFEAWATGMSLCGRSTTQGPLPDGTPVTCEKCEQWRPQYEAILAQQAAEARARETAHAAGGEAERDRYRSAWLSARERAACASETINRVCDDRDSWKGWARNAQKSAARLTAESAALRARVAELEQQAVSPRRLSDNELLELHYRLAAGGDNPEDRR